MSNLIKQSVQNMTGYVPGEQPEDKGLIKLNTNENPFPPSPAVTEALRNMDSGKLSLYPDPVSTGLSRKIADLHGCDISNVFVSNGSDEILALCTRAFVEDDGVIGYFNPSYSLYPVLSDIRNVRQAPVELGPDFAWPDGFPGKQDFSLFFLTNPNAPTGLLYSKDQVRRLCQQCSGVVIVDEAYVDFSDDNCVDLAMELDNAIVARSLSKSYSLAGLRVGYAVGPSALISALFTIKDSYNLNAISQELALAAISDVQYMRENASCIKATRQRLTSSLNDIGFQVCPSQTNFIWTKPALISAKELFDRLREERILVRYFEGDRTKDYIRITIGTDEKIDTLLQTVRSIIAQGEQT